MSEPNDPPEDGRTVVALEPAEPVRAVRRKRTTKSPGVLAIGATLNGIYEVKRFIARGGMGEVYEGVNVETEERVAIKVMLTHLASDPKVQALFRKEARTLTQLAHPAIVQYRVLAREPKLDLYYIVTDFIDGAPLSELMGKAQPTPYQLVVLARRLAQGLGAAHEHGAIHRDMSPDNVLMPGGRLDRAKIIDFGIAKSLDVAAQTVVGDGFAGKLGYVAPEQFGDFGRNIGPWTDIYSTAIVILAFAGGKAPDLGTTLVEAVERRRQGIDLSALPEVLRPLFGRMLAPDPANRIQSMTEVVAELDALAIPPDPEATMQLGASDEAGDAGPSSTPPFSAGPVSAPPVSTPPVSIPPASNPQVSSPPVSTPPVEAAAAAEPSAATPPDQRPIVAHEPTTIAPAPVAPQPKAASPPPPELPQNTSEPTSQPPAVGSPEADRRPISAHEPTTVALGSTTSPPTNPTPSPELQPPEPEPESRPVAAPPPAPRSAAPKAAASPSTEPTETAQEPKRGASKVALIAGVVGLLALAGAGAAMFLKPKPEPQAVEAPAVPLAPDGQRALAAVSAALPTQPCAWVQASGSSGAGGAVEIKLSGAAADPAAVNRAAVAAAQASGVKGLSVDTADVAKLPAARCAMVEAFQAYRPKTPTAQSLTAQQPRFEMATGLQGCPRGVWAQPMITAAPADARKGFTLVAIQPNGALQQVFADRAQLAAFARRYPDLFKDLGGGRYRVSTCQKSAGLVGLLMIEGASAGGLGLKTGVPVPAPGDFPARFRRLADANGWSTSMVWFRLVDEQPNLPEPPVTETKVAAQPAGAPQADAVTDAPLIDAPIATAPTPAGPVPADWAPCRRFFNGVWEEMGYAGRDACVARIFKDHCDVVSGQSGDVQLRRYNGKIEGRGGKLRRWSRLADSTCQAAPAQ